MSADSLPDQGGRNLAKAIENATRGRSAIDTLEAIVSAFCTAIGEPIPQDAICTAARLRAENGAADNFKVAVIDALRMIPHHQPLREALWDAVEDYQAALTSDEQEATG